MASYKNKTEKSYFAQHLLEDNPSFNKDSGVEVLHACV